jgi:hypothetical protein
VISVFLVDASVEDVETGNACPIIEDMRREGNLGQGPYTDLKKTTTAKMCCLIARSRI